MMRLRSRFSAKPVSIFVVAIISVLSLLPPAHAIALTGNPITDIVQPLAGLALAPAVQTAAVYNDPESCGLVLLGSYQWGRCLIEPFISGVGAVVLYMNATILYLVGGVFDWVLNFGLTRFSNLLSLFNIGRKIDVGWSVFRDLANIFIIGFFTYIAFNVILGNETYGNKRLITRVILIAVLLNFSLLFTKMVIETSNLVAYQFYQNANIDKKDDIAGAFLGAMGIDSTFNCCSKQIEKAAGVSTVKDNNWMEVAGRGFTFGVVGGVLLFFTSLTLIYGIVLILTRAVSLIFVMLFSSLAFTTYLVPSIATGRYGFTKWREALLNAAIFAPLVLLSIWISLLMLTAVNAANGVSSNNAVNSSQAIAGGAAGSFAGTNAKNNPQGIGSLIAQAEQPPTAESKSALQKAEADPRGSSWGILLGYGLGIGFLFVSFRVSSKIASSIAGTEISGGVFSGAAAAGGGAIVGTVGGVVGALGGGALYRNTAGRVASNLRGGADLKRRSLDSLKKEDKTVFTRFGSAFAGLRADMYKKIATHDAGGSAKAGETGYEGRRAVKQKEITERANSEANERVLRKEDKDKLREEVMKSRPEFSGFKELQRTVEQGEASLAKDSKEFAKAIEDFNNRNKEITQMKEASEKKAATVAKGGGDIAAVQEERAKIASIEQEHSRQKGALNEQLERINKARSELREHKKTLARQIEDADRVLGQTVDLKRDMAEVVGERAYKRPGTLISRMLGGTANNDEFARQARKPLDEAKKSKTQQERQEAEASLSRAETRFDRLKKQTSTSTVQRRTENTKTQDNLGDGTV